MGLLDALGMGSQALLTHQAAIQVTGNNIANSSTPGYARQKVVTASAGKAVYGAGLSSGAGVKIGSITRMIDMSIVERMNDAYSRMSEEEVKYSTLSRIESLMNELTETDVSNGLSEFFNAFSELATQASEMPTRDTVIARAQTLVNRFDYIADGLREVSDTITDQIAASVVEADKLAESIADLNNQIVRTESGGGSAASLRDERDRAVSDLSQLMEVTVREDEDGAFNVFLGSETLVFGGNSRGLCMAEHPTKNGEMELMVSFSDNKGVVPLRSGQITGLQQTRDGEVAEIMQRVNSMVNEFIWQVNRIHSEGTPLIGHSEMTSSYVIDRSDVPLDSPLTNLPYSPENGSFLLKVANETGNETKQYQIDIDLPGDGTGTTLEDLANAINAAEGVSASVNVAGELQIKSDSDNYSFYFSDDSSGVLASLGLGTFFTGSNASDIEVNETVVEDRRLIAAGLTDEAGDGNNALKIAELEGLKLNSLSGKSLSEYHQEIIADLAVWTQDATDSAAANEVVFDALTAQKESLSGVSLDEETVNLMTYQRAYQGAARYISVVNEMLDTLINMV